MIKIILVLLIGIIGLVIFDFSIWWCLLTWLIGGPIIAEVIAGQAYLHPDSNYNFISMFQTLIGGPLLWVAMIYETYNS